MRYVALALSAGIAIGLVFSGAFLGIVWLAGGLRTSGNHLDWNVVIALATAGAAMAAIGALTAVSFGVEQLRATKRTERLALAPYLRVDVGLIQAGLRPGPASLQRGFTPPPSPHVFDAEDFGPNIYVDAIEALRPRAGEPTLDIGLWVTNKQTAPLGNAFQISIGLYVASETDIAEVVVRLAYVEAGKTTAVRIAKVRADVPELTVSVFAVSYTRMYVAHELRNRHGALNLYYDAARGIVENDRSYGLGEAP